MTTQRRPRHSTNLILQLRQYGHAARLDYPSRRFIVDGGLKTLVEQDGLDGTASNASILEKAIAATTDYDTSLGVAEADGNSDIMALYEKLAIVVPAGAITKNTVQQSRYWDRATGIHCIDCGTSGGAD